MKKLYRWMIPATAIFTAVLFTLMAVQNHADVAAETETVQQEASEHSSQDFASEVDLSGAIELAFEEDALTASADGEELTEKQRKAAGIKYDGDELKIEEEGTYILSGNLTGEINISSSKSGQVNLVLNGFTAQSETGSALYVKKTGTLVIYLADGTENVFTSGNVCEITETSAQEAEDANGGALYSKANTIIKGTGSLTVNGYINNGIQITKNLTIESGNIHVTAVNNGMKVKDTYTQNGGDINILSGGDAVEAKREAQEARPAVIDETTGTTLQDAQEQEDAAGTMIINNGTLSADSFGDGIQAYLELVVNGGTIRIKTEGEYPETRDSFGFPGQQGPGGQGRPGEPGGSNPGESAGEAADDSVSEKGLKSDGSITVNAGTIIIDSVDDAVHCAEMLQINDGTITISTGDDGLHSDSELEINGGTVTIERSYEGVEANQITVTGGDIRVTASDDGFNANGGTDSFGGPANSRKTAADNNESAEGSSPMPNFNITGGTIYVNSSGDGLDSNGNINVTGGYTVVDGPENAGNGALDSGMENGGTLLVSGGIIFAGGASGMAETFEASSPQTSVKCILPQTYKAGTVIKMSDSSGKVLFEHRTASSGNCVVFSCPELQDAGSVILTVDDTEYTLPLSSTGNQLSILADGTVQEGASPGGSAGGPGGPGGSPGNARNQNNRNDPESAPEISN